MDRAWLELSNRVWIHPALDVVMVGLTTVGLMALPVSALWLALRGQRRLGWSLVMAQAAALAVTLTFQFMAMRSRPEEVRLLLPTPGYPSFPSGHTAVAFATALTLALAVRRWWVVAAALAYAALMAYSRLYLGHHYPSDVAAGVVLGASIGAGVYGLVLTGGGVAASGHANGLSGHRADAFAGLDRGR
jgi:membrane-associated phospholipid phosphatase